MYCSMKRSAPTPAMGQQHWTHLGVIIEDQQRTDEALTAMSADLQADLQVSVERRSLHRLCFSKCCGGRQETCWRRKSCHK
jgi:hypothetical protein